MPTQSPHESSTVDPASTYDYWLKIMKGWAHEPLCDAAADLDAPHAKRAAANYILNAESRDLNKSLMPVSDATFERIANRTEFVPKAGGDITINAALVNVGVEQLLERIDGFLRGRSGGAQRTFDVAESTGRPSLPTDVPDE